MKIGLFIPCYVNACFPEVGVASLRLLRALDLDVVYPEGQTCCGQPGANGGFEQDSADMAKRMERLFEGCDYVVGPSASCVVFMKEKYPVLLGKEVHECLSSRIYEICEFIHDVVCPSALPWAHFPHKVSLHNSCHGHRILRLASPSELAVPTYSKLRDLLEMVDGVEVTEPERRDECCGFGGLFSIEEADTSVRMGGDKVKAHMNTGAEYITGADSSCLMHMGGIIKRNNMDIKTIHIVEILASGLNNTDVK